MPIYKEKNKKKSWYVKVNNKTKRGFSTKAEAKEYETKLLNGTEQNTSSIKESSEDDVPSFIEVANEYLKDVERNVAYSSFDYIQRAVRQVIIPLLDNRKINEYKELDCKRFRDSIQSKDYSTRYKNFILNKYKCIFKFAVKYYGLLNDPSRNLDTFKFSFKEKVKFKEKEMQIWTNDEFNKFILFVDKEEYKMLFIILYFTGMRLGEALALTWQDYDGSRLKITKSCSKLTNKGTFIIKETKNMSSIREIDLNRTICSVLDRFKSNRIDLFGFKEDWFIFNRNTPLPRTSIGRVKDKACDLSGVKRITIHEFRHSHASNLIAGGCNIVAVSRRLGHSDVNVTLKIYTHLFRKSNEELVNYLEESSQNLLNFFSISSQKQK